MSLQSNKITNFDTQRQEDKSLVFSLRYFILFWCSVYVFVGL